MDVRGNKKINRFFSFTVIVLSVFVLFLFFYPSSIKAGTCYSCDDLGPDPKCAAGGSCCTHKVAPDQENFNCGGDQWMGYTEGGTKYCCTGYYGYECGSGGSEPPLPCTACTPVCKDPLLGTEKLDIYKVPKAFSCKDSEPAGCTGAKTRYKTCWEVPSPQPSVALSIHPENLDTSLGFTSDTYTGGGMYSSSKDYSVNDFMPYSSIRYSEDDNTFYMNATFTDTDLKIEATYIWFTQNSTTPITPKKLDLDSSVTPKKYGTNSESDFGFMMNYRDDQWVPYIPAIYGDGDDDTDWWKKAGDYKAVEVIDGKSVFSIPGKNGGVIANVVIYSITRSDDGKKVELKLGISFKEKNTPYNLLSKQPKEGGYSIWLMGNDKFGFTPYDNYTEPKSVVTAMHNRWVTNERIRFYDQWKDTGLKWNLNFDSPNITLKFEPVGKTSLKVIWDFIADVDFLDEFSNLVLNVYKSDELAIPDVIVSSYGNAKVPDSSFTVKTLSDSGDVVGHLDYSKNRYLLMMDTDGGDGSVRLNLGDVGPGFLYFYITAFDKGGNIATSGLVPFDLRDWMITQGGLLYSNNIGFDAKDLTTEPTGWSGKSLLKRVPYQYADFSTELVGIRSLGALGAPISSLDTKGYMIRPYTPKLIQGYYNTLKGLFDRRIDSLPILKKIDTSILSGNLSSYSIANGQIGYITTDNLTVNNNFVCNREGVFFVKETLTISGEILNADKNKDACIFVTGGNVILREGNKSSVLNTGVMQYDEVNSYVLADGSITIEKENASLVFDGIYINGGMHSLSTEGVLMNRILKLEDRLRYPILVVDHHSKYGVLARKVFGSSTLIQKTEIGIKPY